MHKTVFTRPLVHFGQQASSSFRVSFSAYLLLGRNQPSPEENTLRATYLL